MISKYVKNYLKMYNILKILKINKSVVKNSIQYTIYAPNLNTL